MKSMILVLLMLQAYGQDLAPREWKLSSMIYRGENIGLPNPELNLSFTFYQNGEGKLRWDRGNPMEFCERWASWEVQDGLLIEEVIKVHPDNAAECAKDPDMQLGRKTKTPIQFGPNEIQLFFPLGEEELIYVLKGSSVSLSN